MLEWKNIIDEYHAQLRTPFALLRVEVDMTRTISMDNVRYMGIVETINGARLRAQDDIPTMEDARWWCEEAYLSLIAIERMRILAR